MKIALLGCDADVLELASEIQASHVHRIVAVYAADAWRTQLEAFASEANWGDQWESLLLGNAADAVIVASGDFSEARVDQLRKLVQAPVPLVLVHPACEAIVALELDMIRRDTRCVMVTHSPGRLHPLFTRLRELQHAETSPLGQVEQIVFERTMPQRERTQAMRQFASDAELVRCLLGNVNKISATGGTAGSAITNLTVHMSNQNNLSARWSLEPIADGEPHGKLVLFGVQQRATLWMPAAPATWRLEISGVDSDKTSQTWSDSHDTLTRLELALQGTESAPAWPVVCRTLEVVDAAERSLARGRTIELQETVVSEEDTFKGMMAAGGCFLLLAVLFVIFVFSVIEGIRLASHSGPTEPLINRPNPIVRPDYSSPSSANAEPFDKRSLLSYWPIGLATVLVVFLLLQFLQLVFTSKISESGMGTRDEIKKPDDS